MPRPTDGLLFPRGITNKQTILSPALIETNVADTSRPLFKVCSIAGLNGASPYRTTLNDPCVSSWSSTGSFCNKLYPNDPSVIFKYNVNAGATWHRPTTSGIGVLVIDLGETITLNKAVYFQMFSDSKVTHIQAFTHPAVGSTAPLHTDSGWVELHPESIISAGTTSYGDILATSASPITIPNLAAPTRYVMFYAKNDGRYGGSSYIEIGGIKLFNTPTETPQYIMGVIATEILDAADVTAWDNLPGTAWDELCQIL